MKRIYKITNHKNGKIYITESKKEQIVLRAISQKEFKSDFLKQNESDYTIEKLREYEAKDGDVLNEKDFYIFIEWIKESALYNIINIHSIKYICYMDEFLIAFAYNEKPIYKYLKTLSVPQKKYIKKVKELMGDNFYKLVFKKLQTTDRSTLAKKYNVSQNKIRRWRYKAECILEKESKDSDLIDLQRKYHLYDGFDSVKEAKSFLLMKHFEPESFAYISVEDKIYVVSIETLEYEIVVTKKFSYIRQNFTGFVAANYLINWKEVHKYKKPRSSRYWDNTYANELRKVYDVRVAYLGHNCRTYEFRENSITLLACFFNRTINNLSY